MRRNRLGGRERAVGALLAGGRIAIGLGIWAAPTVAARGLGMAPWRGEALAVARLAATRDLILGAWLASELRDGGRPRTPAAALTACDAGDALTFALLAARGATTWGQECAASGPRLRPPWLEHG